MQRAQVLALVLVQALPLVPAPNPAMVAMLLHPAISASGQRSRCAWCLGRKMPDAENSVEPVVISCCLPCGHTATAWP